MNSKTTTVSDYLTLPLFLCQVFSFVQILEGLNCFAFTYMITSKGVNIHELKFQPCTKIVVIVCIVYR